jgi:hypothetical protein
MDVINCLCVPLGSSTVQLHDNLGSRRACACSEAGLVVKLATVLEGVLQKSSVMLYSFCGQKDSLQTKFLKKNVSCGKYLPRKAIHNWVEKFSQRLSKAADDARPDAEVAETTVKRLLCCGFRRTGKAMGQVYQCRRRICRE